MGDTKRLGKEILDRLEFQSELGARWTRRGGARPRPAAPAPTASQPAPARAPQPAAAAQPARVFANARSIFDSLERSDETLEQIRADLGDCRRCKLAPTRTHIVFGSGSATAELMFVGEAPGADEDEQGLPFVGRAGQLLTKIIEAIGMTRDEVYICNILKCRPPGNRNPEPDEIAACQPFLFRQIATIRPRVVCALGTFGAQTLLGTREPISRLRGELVDFRGAKLMATFHPAYLLRNPNEKRKVWEDVQKVRDYLVSLRPR